MVCQSEFSKEELAGYLLPKCPKCLTSIKPMNIANDGYIKMNWEEIRLLAIYAQRWVGKFDAGNTGNKEYITAVQNIINKIQLYQPKTSKSLDPIEEKPPRDEKGNITKPLPSPYFN